MKKILGIDLGVASIGWAFVENKGEAWKILGLGSRIVPLDTNEESDFHKGSQVSKNKERTLKRGARRGYDRYQLRRTDLQKKLREHSMLPDATYFSLSAQELYGLRDRATREQIELPELGRILLHLNQKRGYKSSRKDQNTDTKITEYEKTITDRYDIIKQQDITVGQYFYRALCEDERFRVKENVFLRRAYIEEFDTIWKVQATFYPAVLTASLQTEIRNKILYYQRPLKSQKGLVSVCEFEGKEYKDTRKNKDTEKTVFAGPKVAPKSSPLFQVCTVWERLNNLSVEDSQGKDLPITPEQRQAIFDRLDTREKVSETELFKILGIRKNDGYTLHGLTQKGGLQGNLTKAKIKKALDGYTSSVPLLSFVLTDEDVDDVDKETGEVTERKRIKADYEEQPLYRLWHALYSIHEEEDVIAVLKKRWDIPEDRAAALAKIDFTQGGFGNKSARCMRKIIPYLREGYQYEEACSRAGFRHADYMTREENTERLLKDELELFPKNSLRQPIVEKVLNQLVHLVNALIEHPKYGRPDEIRVEMARDLAQSREGRERTEKRMRDREKYHKSIRKKLSEHPEFTKNKITKRDLDRYKLWEEFEYCSPYEPGKKVGLGSLFNGEYDIEHIIPKSRIFDDSFSNKTICPRKLNAGEYGKNQMTAYDFMEKRGPEALEGFCSLVKNIYTKGRISRTKREKLLMSQDKIPDDFIARHLNDTRYISKKAKEMLTGVCRNVYTTSGSVTDYLRFKWGWHNVLMQLNWDKYPDDLKETITLDGGAIQYKIKGWSKRDDHRHHAVDALTVACTTHGIVHRLNDLNKRVTVQSSDQSQQEALKEYSETGLDKYIEKAKPFCAHQVQEAVAPVVISFKPGQKVATWGVRKVKKDGKSKIVQRHIITPRGALSEESVYGKISMNGTEHYVMKYKLGAGAGHVFSSPKDTKKKIEKDLSSIVDKKVREVVRKRIEAHDYDLKEAFKNLEENPIWMNEEKRIPIKTIRCKTGLSAVEPIKVYDRVNDLHTFKYVKPGNNHHVALYTDAEGEHHESVVTFWHAVERKKYGIPVIITDPQKVWDKVLQMDLPEAFLDKLPEDGWRYTVSMQRNELFVFDHTKEEVEACIAQKQYDALARTAYRVQKITTKYYVFRHHLETRVDDKLDGVKNEKACMEMGKFIRLSSLKAYFKSNPVKVRTNILGEIVALGT